MLISCHVDPLTGAWQGIALLGDGLSFNLKCAAHCD
jgi:hypothetical protein